MTFNQEFSIHPVGQGLFYTGRFSIDDRDRFNMVYDCGSISGNAGERCVDQFLDMLSPTEPIDLLVISHFDEDHVNKLERLLQALYKNPTTSLLEPRKIKNLVLPFMNFQERLFLALRTASDSSPDDPNRDFTISFIIDPLGTLRPNLDDDSNIFIVDHGPDKPVSPDQSIERTEADTLTFDIPGAIPAEVDFLSAFKVGQIVKPNQLKQTNDSQKGIVYSIHLLMEFIFYRKRLGTNDEKFFDEVKKRFFYDHKISAAWTDDQILTETIKIIRKVKGSPKIKKLFEAAYKKMPKEIDVAKSHVLNMNTTALCMLHVNKKDLGEIHPYHGRAYAKVFPLTTDHFIQAESLHYYYDYHKNCYPNTFMTSDGFFLKKADTDALLTHYKNYLNVYWLWQVPHHGSSNNSNAYLLSHITGNVFINYGLDHKRIKAFKHPSVELMQELLVAGLTKCYFAVNEVRGITFQATTDF